MWAIRVCGQSQCASSSFKGERRPSASSGFFRDCQGAHSTTLWTAVSAVLQVMQSQAVVLAMLAWALRMAVAVYTAQSSA